jgi:hypothetical protein
MRRFLRRLLGHVRSLLRAVKWLTVIQLARLIGQLRGTRQIVSAWPASPVALRPKIVLFMHYDRDGHVRPQMLAYIRDLAANGRSIVFVSNAGRLNERSAAALEDICATVIVRRNIGYDFGAWRAALDHLGLPRPETEEIIFANDSVLGPLIPLAGMLDRLSYEHTDIWGLTDSWQVKYHLQSYFLAFGPAALQAGAFKKFWASVRPVPAKSFIVKAYEVGITQAMLKGGLRCQALWPYETLLRQTDSKELEALIAIDLTEIGRVDPVKVTQKQQALRIRDARARRVTMNPTADLWRQLLVAGFPFIKRELLRYNPSEVQDVGDWIDFLRDRLSLDPEPVLHDLRFMMKDRAP